MLTGFSEGSYEAVRDCSEFFFISLEAVSRFDKISEPIGTRG